MDPNPGEKIENTDEDLDLTESLEEISTDLFGQESDQDDDSGEDEDQDQTSVGEEGQQESAPQNDGETPPQQDDQENSAEVQAVGAPTSWTKEAIQEWAAIPDRAKQEILKREDDILRGIEQYKGRAEIGDRYEKVVEPYRAALAAENIDSVELFNAFAGNHYLLSRGTPQQKLEIASNLMSHYGIDIVELAEQMAGITTVDPQVAALQKEVAALRSTQDSAEQQRVAAARAEADRQIEAFISDPANTYVREVAEDMGNLLRSNPQMDLKAAYDAAVYQNPTTRQKEIDRITAEAISKKTSEQDEAAKARSRATAANVKTSPKTRDSTIPVGTMDETLNEAYEKITSRG